MNNAAPALPARLPRAWVGGDHNEARLQERRAREAGLSVARARVVGHIGSMEDCWAFQSTIADLTGVSVRTVQRATRQAKAAGLIRVHRAKKREHPPGLSHPLPCGWSHRWATSRGMGNARAREAIAAARARATLRKAIPPMARRGRGRALTADELAERRKLLQAQVRALQAEEAREKPD